MPDLFAREEVRSHRDWRDADRALLRAADLRQSNEEHSRKKPRYDGDHFMTNGGVRQNETIGIGSHSPQVSLRQLLHQAK